MELHLVDATYELFRAHHAPRPPVRGRDGVPLTAVAGLAGTLLALVRDEGATHVGCAHDRVIRSFRNDLWPGYKSELGVPPELLAQFPIAEEAITALGFVLWPMADWEADDALATAAVRWADAPGVERTLVCTPDKDLAQVVRGDRVDQTEFPVPKWHYLEGGRYIHTFSAIVTRDPDTRVMNVGMYRGMIGKKDTTPFLLVKGGQHWGQHFLKYGARGEPMPVACVIGWDPVMGFLAGSPIPTGVCEWDVMGAYRG